MSSQWKEFPQRSGDGQFQLRSERAKLASRGRFGKHGPDRVALALSVLGPGRLHCFMCGIAGSYRWGSSDHVRRMCAALAHRGPDADGLFSSPDGDLHLGHRRLSIVDLQTGAQPMPSAEATTWIVFNGEIFNAPTLREELLRAGHRFLTDHSDTEVLLQLWQRHGPEMVRHLNGMFAFVLYDLERRLLFGARDPFGIKPLFFTQRGRSFAFASEPGAFTFLPGLPRVIDAQAVFHYFTFAAIPAPATIWQAVRKLPAGHHFTFTLDTGELRVARYWSPPEPSPTMPDRRQVQQEIRSRFFAAVKRWSLSDVPIACSLSGGLDSSLLVAALARESAQPVPTFTLGFTDAPELDESDLARQVAARWSTRHEEIRLRSADLLAAMPQMIARLGEPYAGGLPAWFVFQAMGRQFKVAMTGTGGDELFGNYGKAHPALDSPALLHARWRYVVKGGSGRLALRAPHGIAHYGGFRDREKRRHLFVDSFTAGLNASEDWIEQAWQQSKNRDPRDAVAAVDLQLQLPEEFLQMTDRFSMAHSIEARTPFLDRELAEFCLGLPASLRCGRPVLKQLLLDSLGDLLPKELIAAPKKGFVLPMGAWLRGALRPEVERLTEPALLRRQGIFRPSIFAHYCAPHLAGRRQSTERVWKILQFQWWAESQGLL